MPWHHWPIKHGRRHPWRDAEVREAEGRTTDCGSEEFRGHVGNAMGKEVDGTECSVRGCLVGTEMENAADKGGNRAGVGVSTAGMANNFTGIGIFLGREGECGKCGKGELCGVSRGSGEGLVANREHNILEVARLVGCAKSRVGVLTGSEEKEKSKGS